MHAKKAVIEAIQMQAVVLTHIGERLSYPWLKSVSKDHHEVQAVRMNAAGGRPLAETTLGVGITPVLAWLDAKRKMGLSRG